MNLHVLAVYFPVGLLVGSVVFDLIAQATKREELARVGWWTLVAGVATGALALVTGIVEAPGSAILSADARTALGVHSTLSYVATILFGILALWRLIGRGQIGERARPAYLAGGVIAAALLLAAVYTGVRGVYVYGIGIPESTLESALEVRERRVTTPPPMPRDTVPLVPDTPIEPDTGVSVEDAPTDTVQTD